jgi:hypothetical protein
MDPIPLTCTLSPDAKRERTRWLDALTARALSVNGGGEGDTLVARFPDDPGLEDELRALAAAEAECCPFLAMTVTRVDGALELAIVAHDD